MHEGSQTTTGKPKGPWLGDTMGAARSEGSPARSCASGGRLRGTTTGRRLVADDLGGRTPKSLADKREQIANFAALTASLVLAGNHPAIEQKIAMRPGSTFVGVAARFMRVTVRLAAPTSGCVR